MATQTSLDLLIVAWNRLRTAVNTTLPNSTDRLRAVKGHMTGSLPPGPKPS